MTTVFVNLAYRYFVLSSIVIVICLILKRNKNYLVKLDINNMSLPAKIICGLIALIICLAGGIYMILYLLLIIKKGAYAFISIIFSLSNVIDMSNSDLYDCIELLIFHTSLVMLTTFFFHYIYDESESEDALVGVTFVFGIIFFATLCVI